MAYDDSTDSGAAAALESEPAPEDATAPREDTFFLPDFPGKEDYKPGDVFKIVGKDADGNLEVECVRGSEEKKDWKTDMRDTMGPNMDGQPA